MNWRNDVRYVHVLILSLLYQNNIITIIFFLKKTIFFFRRIWFNDISMDKSISYYYFYSISDREIKSLIIDVNLDLTKY